MSKQDNWASIQGDCHCCSNRDKDEMCDKCINLIKRIEEITFDYIGKQVDELKKLYPIIYRRQQAKKEIWEKGNPDCPKCGTEMKYGETYHNPSWVGFVCPKCNYPWSLVEEGG